jgi:Leucine-rich repeat (LRR) protein
LAIAVSLLVLVSIITSCTTGAETQVTTTDTTEPGVVFFSDGYLEAAVRDALGKYFGEEITVYELANLTRLEAGNSYISNLAGLEYCTNMTWLNLSSNQITNISPLSSLTNLTWLSLDENEIVNISPLSQLTKLDWLDLSGNQISDISPLVDNIGLGAHELVVYNVWLENNSLDLTEGSDDMKNIKALEERGVIVQY